MFLKSQSKLLLVVLTSTTIANIGGITIYSILNIDSYVQSKKQKIVKSI